jgi:thiamine biosynthesis protein ThiI
MENASVLLCRFGELFLKSGNRRRFERVLAVNIRAAVADLQGARVEETHGRILVRVRPDDAADAANRLARVFGLVSFSIARKVAAEPDLEAMSAAAVEATRGALAERAPSATPTTFKVESRRSDKRFAVPSLEMSRRIGARIQGELGLPVDVHTPSLTIGVEVGDKGAFVYAGTRESPGGLPVGVSGRALLLLSGGIDSPVAGWLAAKRGLALDGVYFHSPPT